MEILVKNLIEQLNQYDPESIVLLQVRGVLGTLESVSATFYDGEIRGVAPTLSDNKNLVLTELGEAIRNVRTSNGIALRRMAEYMGIPPSFLSSIEFGRTVLRKKDALELLSFVERNCDLTKEENKTFSDTVCKYAVTY